MPCRADALVAGHKFYKPDLAVDRKCKGPDNKSFYFFLCGKRTFTYFAVGDPIIGNLHLYEPGQKDPCVIFRQEITLYIFHLLYGSQIKHYIQVIALKTYPGSIAPAGITKYAINQA